MGSLPAQYNFETGASCEISFYLNGTRINLDGNAVDPDSTLLDFVRSAGFTGTKLGCNEGGCGACSVVLQSKNFVTGQLEHKAVNACLMPLVAVDGKHVITVEGLGNSENPHPIQERMYKLSGSQCGFCSPGFVMSIYALLRNATANGQLTVEDAELEGALDGNLCRCGAYRGILNAVKSFVGEYLKGDAALNDKDYVVPVNFEAASMAEEEGATKECCNGHSLADVSTDVSLPAPTAKETSVPPIDADAGVLGRTAPSTTQAVKDAGLASSTTNGSLKGHGPQSNKPKGCGRADCCQLQDKENLPAGLSRRYFPRFEFKPYRPGTELIFPPALHRYQLKPLAFGNKTRRWLRPTTLKELLAIKAHYPDAKVVGGSSEIQIEVHYKAAKYPVSVYVSDIPELYTPAIVDKESFKFGANLSLTDLETACKQVLSELAPELRGPVEAIRAQLRYFAGWQVRNVASVGGNIATASPISDLNPVWIATGTKIVAETLEDGEFELVLDEKFFIGYRRIKLPAHAVIKSVIVPLNTTGEREVVKAFKQAKRKDDDIAIVTCAFKILVDAQGQITFAKFAYGGMAAFTVSCPKTQAFVTGKPFNKKTLDDALLVLSDEVNLTSDVPGGMPSYRKTLAMSFFFKFFTSASVDLGIVLDPKLSDVDLKDLAGHITRKPTSGYRDNTDPYALEVSGKQVPHMSGLRHLTGEAVYVDDMPKYANEAYGCLVLSTHAHAKILSVDPAVALEMPGVFAYIDHNDLPSEKANYWGSAAQDEKFFAVDECVTHGQPIGLIVAENKLVAQKAARAVIVKYEDLPMILTIEEAVEAKSFHPQYDRRIARGTPIEQALKESEHRLSGRTRMGGQEHFYLETQACLVLPRLESGEIEVYSSTQAVTDTQRWVAQVTGVPRNRIVSKVKRLGGGFGGKESRTGHLAAICALAAKKLRRPIRAMLDRNEDIMISGQRHPCLAEWEVGFDSQGKLHALKTEFYANAGHSLDISGGVADRALAHLDNSYYIPNVDVHALLCKTNTVSNTAFRGFGGPQGMVVADHYLEAIAHYLKLDVDHVREINLYQEGQKTPYHQKVVDWHVPRMIKELKVDADYEARKKAVAEWNAEHHYRKRGISLISTKFGLAFGVKAMNQGHALVHIYLDGSVLLAHGGTEMGQGLYTKCAQLAAQELQVPLEAIFTSETSTATCANTSPTAASAGSDIQGHATHIACAELNKRLEPYREKLGPNASMASLAAAAYADRIELSATGHWATPELGYVWNCQEETGNLFAYFTQGVAISEVEVDILTGDHTVLRTDIRMDVGKSISPAIDYGQVEGAFYQGAGWSTIEESLWLRHNGAIFTTGPGAYKVYGASDVPQELNISFLKNADWPHLKSIRGSKGIGEPPLYLGTSIFSAIRDALKSARSDAGIEELQEFRLPLTAERIRLSAGDALAQAGKVEPKEGERGSFFVHI